MCLFGGQVRSKTLLNYKDSPYNPYHTLTCTCKFNGMSKQQHMSKRLKKKPCKPDRRARNKTCLPDWAYFIPICSHTQHKKKLLRPRTMTRMRLSPVLAGDLLPVGSTPCARSTIPTSLHLQHPQLASQSPRYRQYAENAAQVWRFLATHCR